MKPKISNLTVILLLNIQIKKEINFVRKWFQKSRFRAIEAENVFQAIGDKEDFTTPKRPQIILLKVNSLIDDFLKIRKVTRCFSDNERIAIMALSDSHKILNHEDCFEGSLSEIKLKLDQLMPENIQIGVAV